jgi:hypothetical protein
MDYIEERIRAVVPELGAASVAAPKATSHDF